MECQHSGSGACGSPADTGTPGLMTRFMGSGAWGALRGSSPAEPRRSPNEWGEPDSLETASRAKSKSKFSFFRRKSQCEGEPTGKSDGGAEAGTQVRFHTCRSAHMCPRPT